MYLSLYTIEKPDRRERIYREVIQASAYIGFQFQPVKIQSLLHRKMQGKKAESLGFFTSNTNEFHRSEKYTESTKHS